MSTATKSAAIQIAAQARVPTYLLGLPGGGKTKHCQAIGRTLEVNYPTWIALIHDPADFAGYPSPDEKEGIVRLMPVGSMWKDLKAADVVILDDVNYATPMQQAALLRPVLEGFVGDRKLPDVAWIAVGNPPDRCAGANDLIPALANRFFHLEWSTDARSWAAGMIGNWPDPTPVRLPDKWQDFLTFERVMIAEFVKKKPDALWNMPKDESAAGRAWPSPRSWNMASTLLAARRSLVKDMRSLDDLANELLCGCVGAGAAGEYHAWRSHQDLPDPEEMIQDPDKCELPKRGDKLHVCLASVVSSVLSDCTVDRWKAGSKILCRAVDLAPDIAAACALAHAARIPKQLNGKFPPEYAAFHEVLKAAKML